MQRQTNPFNFEKSVQRLLHRIQLEPEALDDDFASSIIETSLIGVKKEVYAISKEESILKKRESTHAAMFQTRECIIYAFCTTNTIETALSIDVINKQTQDYSQMALKGINLEVTEILFALGADQTIHLLLSTSCGRLLVYKTFEETDVTIQSIKFSSNRIECMLAPSAKGLVFALNKAGTIYFINFQQNKVKYEFRCSLPLIEDPKPRLIIDLSQRFIGQVFGFGRIILWEISEEMKCIKNDDSSGDQTNLSIASIDKGISRKQSEQSPKEKKFVLRSKMSITNCLMKGITWCDFLGIFIMVIDHEGELLVLAINVNEFNESQEFYTIISSFQICKPNPFNSYQQKESIIDAKRLYNSNGIIVGKNVEIIDCGKKILTECFLEKYTFDEKFKINKMILVSLKFCQISQMEQFLLNSTGEYLMIRNKNEFELVRNKEKKLA